MLKENEFKYITGAFNSLVTYVEAEKFKGYDPYDTLNSWFPFKAFGKTVSILALQFQKRNPLNIRGLLGVSKQPNNMGIGLFLKGYCELQQQFPQKNYTQQIETLMGYIKENQSKGFENACWGYNFDWPTSKKMIGKGIPNAVVTSFVCSGLFQYYRLTKNKDAERLIHSAGKFVLENLKQTTFDAGLCFSYTPIEVDCCYNASLLSALVLAQSYSISKDKMLLNYITGAVSFVVSKQFADGHWNYSIDKNTGTERRQIDFHQGFILDCLFDIQQLIEQKTTGVDEAIVKGAEYYYNQQFLQTGQSLWRLPKEFPVDIHNQSQGIITFLKLSEIDANYNSFAGKIAAWTIENMQHKKGYFFYRNYPLYKIRIPYMRWSQANMFYALTQIIIRQNNA